MSNVKLSAKWQLDAALLSRPVDLTALVTLSKRDAESFLEEDKAKDGSSKGNSLQRLISLLLNEKNLNKSDKDTKLDVLTILANVAIRNKKCNLEVRTALSGISEWFDEYMNAEENDSSKEPELHKAMVLLLARCWEYSLKTEDVLELTMGDRRIALCTVVGLLEDGETYSTTLKQRQRPGQGKMGQWEHELVVQRYEKPLLLQVCRLLRGFTHPATYFDSHGEDIALYSVEKFGEEMDTLLEITLRSRFVEKLSAALFDCLFNSELEDESSEDGKGASSKDSKEDYIGLLEESDHLAVACVHAFLQNLYFYASENVEIYRQHMLMDTLLIPQLILPYLEKCVTHALILNSRAELYNDLLEGDQVSQLVLHNPQLVQGINSSLRTLIIASFRAPNTEYVMILLRRMNPTAQMLKATTFCKYNDYVFALLCLLNVNMGALDLSRPSSEQSAHILLHELSKVFSQMDPERQSNVFRRVTTSGALPISRDTPSYTAVMSVLLGGSAGQLSYSVSSEGDGEIPPEDEENSAIQTSRAECKKDFADRMAYWNNRMAEVSQSQSNNNSNQSTLHSDMLSDVSAMEKLMESISMENKETAEEKDSSSQRLSSFDIAVAVAQSSQKKEAKAAEPSDGYRLLGDLPSLMKKDRSNDVKVALNLELPDNFKNPKTFQIAKKKSTSSSSVASTSSSSKDDIPKEFLCSINGHVMKDPVYDKKSGLRFERETIYLWLSTRGAVCPITLQPLYKEDLVPDDELKNRIKRYHIQQTALRPSTNADDDLYDF